MMYSVAGPGGFEPPTTGLGGRRHDTGQEATMQFLLNGYPREVFLYLRDLLDSRAAVSRLTVEGNRLVLEFDNVEALTKFVEFLRSLGISNIQKREIRIMLDKQFEEYLRKDRQLSERTVKDYLNYLKKLENEVMDYSLYLRIAHHKWMVKAVRLYIDYLFKAEKITAEEYQKLRSIFKVKQKRSVKPIAIDEEELILVFFHENLRPHEKLLFEILLFSGVRFSEAVKLVNEFDESKLECFENHCRYALFWSRGRKRCDWIYLPMLLVEELKKYRGLFVEKNLRTLYRNLKRKFGVDVKNYRKLFYRSCREVAEKEVCDFYQSRISRLSVGDIHYDNLLSRADKDYPKIVERIKQDIVGILESMSDGVPVSVIEVLHSYENNERGEEEERTIWELHMDD